MPSRIGLAVRNPFGMESDSGRLSVVAVGQPRDGDVRASFAVLDLDAQTFTVHREQYDIAAAQLASQRCGLHPLLADRLALGA